MATEYIRMNEVFIYLFENKLRLHSFTHTYSPATSKYAYIVKASLKQLHSNFAHGI